ncbi:hypothetical protein ILUMI_11757 [Ignelater luminosus]|uniref:Cytochrome P450 n=1 Tax=Ignelater luminosus TaxID=2038154 RepID=A0A8K0GA72_IGNLU|nr:hypothetical protein ILUMI_11757 [Ignelater luminosus]
MIVVNDYKCLEFFLNSTKILDKSPEYKFLGEWLGTGLLLSDGDEKWKRHRKILTPAFHFKILEQFVDTFQSNTNILVEKLKKEVGKSSTDIYPYVNLCTLDIICETAMGTQIHAQEHSNSEYVTSVKAMCKIIIDRSFNPFLQYTFPYIFTEQYRTEKKSVKILHDVTNSVIKKRQEEVENHINAQSAELESLGVKRRLAFLDLLLEEKKKGQILSDVHIREEVDTFMFAGHDTTASGLSFTLYCLSEHPEVQQAVVNELQDIFEDNKTRSITLRDLQEMKYMEAVIKESLRLYPPVPFTGREVKEDVEYDGTVLPEGLGVVLLIYGIHRDPKLFPEPEKFLPERFYSENTAGKLPFGYIPFSAGSRNCIGQRFALLEIKSVLANILRNFIILPSNPKHNLEIVAETVIKSANGVCVQLKEREF